MLILNKVKEQSQMIKQVLLLSLMGVSLTGCIVAPYDDYNYSDRNRHYDQNRQGYDRDRDGRWKQQRNDRDEKRWEQKKNDHDKDRRDRNQFDRKWDDRRD